MSTSKHPVFIAFQANNDTLPIIQAIVADNPEATVNEMPSMVKIDCPGRLIIKRETIEEEIGRDFDLQELQINLISLSGSISEDDDEFTLSWE